MGDLKSQIKKYLEELVDSGILGEVQVDNASADLFERDIGRFPVAILTTPSTESQVFQNTQNRRTHVFEVIVIQKQENITDPDDVEAIIEALLDKFDNLPSLKGAANGGVEPSSSPVAIVPGKGGSFIAFAITLRCSVIKDLTF